MKMSAFPNLRGEQREVAETYYETLRTKLTGNDKIVINALSELANENRNNAKIIVETIERRVFEANSDHLLAHLYLIDSICKNHWAPFSDLFNNNIVRIFVYVFSKANEKVRSSLYKLRHTWTAAPLFSAKLRELDTKVAEVDPAWPVLSEYPGHPQHPTKSHKILINPAKFPQSTPKPAKSRGEEETERLRQELLTKEKELLEFKKQEIDKKLQGFKKKEVAAVGVSVTTDDAKISSTKKVESGGGKESRDPRRRRKAEEKTSTSTPAKGDSKSSSRSDTKKSDSGSSSRREKSPKKAKSEKTSSSTNGSSSKSSSRSSSKSDKKPSPKKEEKRDREPSKKREREPSPKFSPADSPVNEGRISPLPAPPAKRIPKLVRKSDDSAKDEIKVVAEKRADKRLHEDRTADPGSLPEKRPKPLIDLVDDDPERDSNSPVVGWAKHKESNPDNFRTPVKEMGPFFPDQQQQEGPFGPWMEDRGGWGRGLRGHRGFRRDRGNMRGRWNDSQRFQGPGPMVFGRGGGMRPGPGGPGFHRPRGPPPPALPGLPPLDIMNANPEIIRKEVIPNMIKLGRECMDKGTINEHEFNEFFNQVMLLKETSLNREVELRQENKENRFHRGRGRGGAPGPGPERQHNGDGSAPVRGVEQAVPAPHKNDLPLADPAQLEEIKGDPTKNLNIDDLPRPIRYYGETATIVLEDANICELNFKPERDTRQIVIDNNIRVYCRVNADHYTEFTLKGRTHKIKIGKPTRELWVDGEWHECYFNNRARVRIDGRFTTIFLPGPPPSVDIGVPRPDLCLGRVYVLVDGNVRDKIPLYLDMKPQFLIIGGKPHVWRFLAGFRECTINGHPFRTDFGGFPSVISVQGKKHYLRLTSLPPGVQLAHDPNVPKPLSPRAELRQSPPMGGNSPPHPGDDIGLHAHDPLNQMIINEMMNPTSSSGMNSPSYNTQETRFPGVAEQLQPAGPPPFLTSTPVPPLATPTLPAPQTEQPQQQANINDLWAKLQSSGVFSLFGSGGGGSGIPGLDPGTPAPTQEPAPAAEPMVVEQLVPAVQPVQKKVRRQSLSVKDVVLRSNDISLKTRQDGIIESLFGSSDLQCKSCGLRFNPEEMGLYSGHLDWHFRARRRERDNARKAQSRRWYYEKNDWIVSDEIEDDEQDMTEEEIILEQSLEVPTVAVKRVEGKEGGKGEETCPVCMELFNQIYKQGEGDEEGSWFLHNAMRDTDTLAYHPECFKDKAAQEKRDLETSINTDQGNTTDNTSNVKEEKMEVDAPKVEPATDIVPTPVVKEEPAVNEEGAATVETAEVKTEAESPVKTEPALVDTDNTVEEKKPEDGAEVEVKKEGAEVTEEAANKTVNLETEDSALQAPVLAPQPKVEIKVSLTSAPQVERRESNISLDESMESDSEFDSEATIVSGPSEEERDLAKPRLKGRKLMALPPINKDSDVSGLCSIM